MIKNTAPELYVIDPESLDRIATIDLFESLQWNTGYNTVGSFQLNCSVTYFGLLTPERIIQNSYDDKHNGLIEHVEKLTDEEGVESLVVRGNMIEKLLSRRVAVGNYLHYTAQPGAVIRDLIYKNTIDTDETRKMKLELGTYIDSDEGTIDYASSDTNLLEEVGGIAKEGLLGYCLRVDYDKKKLVFDLYKGTNRTERENTQTSIEERNISQQQPSNWDFSDGRNGWSVSGDNGFSFKSGGVYGRLLKKEKVWEKWVDPDTGETFRYPLYSGYFYQNVNVNSEHIYYIAIRCNNPTDSVVGFGMKEGETCSIVLSNESDFRERSFLYVPDKSGTKQFVMGYGDLSDEKRKEGEFLLMDYGYMIDLTATFGAGQEPTKDWCDTNIYYLNGWKYKVETKTLTPNAEEPLVLSRDRDLLLRVEYIKNIENHKTYMYIKGDGLDTSITTGDDSGIKRKELSLNLTSEIPRQMDGITIPQQSYINMLQNRAWMTLQEMVANEMVNAELYLLSNKQFGRDFYLGDIVDCVDSSIGFSVSLRITSAQEVWDRNGYSLSITLGDDLPDLKETIRLVSKGVK